MLFPVPESLSWSPQSPLPPCGGSDRWLRELAVAALWLWPCPVSFSPSLYQSYVADRHRDIVQLFVYCTWSLSISLSAKQSTSQLFAILRIKLFNKCKTLFSIRSHYLHCNRCIIIADEITVHNKCEKWLIIRSNSLTKKKWFKIRSNYLTDVGSDLT